MMSLARRTKLVWSRDGKFHSTTGPASYSSLRGRGDSGIVCGDRTEMLSFQVAKGDAL